MVLCRTTFWKIRKAPQLRLHLVQPFAFLIQNQMAINSFPRASFQLFEQLLLRPKEAWRVRAATRAPVA